MRGHLINLSVIAALVLGCAPACAVAQGHRPEPPISKIETRRQAEPIVIRRVLGQIADLLLTAPSAGADENDHEPITQTDQVNILAGLFKIVQAQPNADQTIHPPQLDEPGVRRTLTDLGDLVTIWPNPFISPHPTTPLYEIAFQTRTYATDIPHLCAVDIVVVNFRRVGARRGAYTKTRAAEVSTNRYYYFLQNPATFVLERSTEAQRHATDVDCARLDHNRLSFFSAADETSAVRGNWWGHWLLSQLHATPIPFDVHCKLRDSATPADCLRALDSTAPHANFDVRECEGGETCSISLNGMLAEMRLAPAALAISSVSLEYEIVIADALKD